MPDALPHMVRTASDLESRWNLLYKFFASPRNSLPVLLPLAETFWKQNGYTLYMIHSDGRKVTTTRKGNTMDSRVTEECIHADVDERQRTAQDEARKAGMFRHMIERIRFAWHDDPREEHHDDACMAFAKLGLLAGRSLWF